MYSTHEAELDLPHLPLAARHVHIVPALTTSSLLSMSQLCDAGCRVSFDATSVHVHHNDTLVLHGARTPTTGLWHLQLAPDPPLINTCAAVHSATPSDLVAFAHAALFSPALSTLRHALDRGFLPQFPGLTAKTLAKYPPHSIAMVKGHLDQTRKNQRSTKPKAAEPVLPASSPLSDHDSAFPPSDPHNERSHHCYAAIVDPTSGQIHTDQTGKFIIASSTGFNYILVLYDYDSNSILVEPMRSRTGPCILQAFQTLHARLVAAGLRPKLHRLDNECSSALKQFLVDVDIDFQLVPPGLHRRNAAERAIRTFKNHFIAGLCSVDKNFPLHLWDKLLPQAELTLNLLRGSRINPKLSAYAQLLGNFDFNRTPLAPPGIRVLVHVKPAERTTWSPHAADGWYTGPALLSYRCFTVWLWDTRATRICDTLSWFPTKVTMPIASSTDLILAGIHDILQAIKSPSPGSPLAPITDSHNAALRQLSEILTSLATPDSPTIAPSSSTPEEPNVPTPPASPLVPPIPHADAPLRVPTLISPTSIPAPDLPLRVADAPIIASPPPSPRGVYFAPLPATPNGTTFFNSTGSIGKRRRRAKRTQTLVKPLAVAKTIHPRKLKSSSQRQTPTHSRGSKK